MAHHQAKPPTPLDAASPIEALATEVLIPIFIYTLPFPGDGFDQNSLRSKSPLVLTEVSRRWRNTALSTPELWKSLEFTEISQRTAQSDYWPFRSGIIGWFSRAGNRPLSLTARFRADRFRESQISFLVPWSSLAHLHIKDDALSPYLLTQVLRQCTNLVECAIAGANWHHLITINPEDFRAVELPHLRTLRLALGCNYPIQWHRHTTLYIFPGTLVVPALERLELHGRVGINADFLFAWPLFNRILIHFQTPLTHLALRGISLNSLQPYLKHLPALKHLHLSPKGYEHHDYTVLLERLSYTSIRPDNVLPHLEVLVIDNNVYNPEEEDRVVLDMVTTRRWGEDANYPYRQEGLWQLKKLHVGWTNIPLGKAPHRATYERAIALQAGGLMISYPTLGIAAQSKSGPK